MKGPTGPELPPSKEEQRLVEGLRRGDEAAFDHFVEAYAPRLFRFAVSRLRGDDEAAREVVQATLVDVLRGLGTFRGEAGLFTWMCRCCQRQICAHGRRAAATREWVTLSAGPLDVEAAVERLAAAEDGPEEVIQQREMQDLVHLTLYQIPERYRDVLQWKYFDGLSVREIASRLELSPKAAESILTRARNAFRQSFREVTDRLRCGDGPAGGLP